MEGGGRGKSNINVCGDGVEKEKVDMGENIYIYIKI